MKKVKYVIKATKFKDNTYEDVVFENQPLSQKQETFSDVKHILDLDFENALDEGKKVQYDGVDLISSMKMVQSLKNGFKT